MKRLVVPLLLCLMLTTSGCQTTPEGKYADVRVATEAFDAIANILIDLYEAGEIDEDDWETIKQVAHAGEQYLHDWRDAIVSGQDPAHIIAAFQGVMDLMQKHLDTE